MFDELQFNISVFFFMTSIKLFNDDELFCHLDFGSSFFLLDLDLHTSNFRVKADRFLLITASTLAS